VECLEVLVVYWKMGGGAYAFDDSRPDSSNVALYTLTSGTAHHECTPGFYGRE
jgi:hypothetical protein